MNSRPRVLVLFEYATLNGGEMSYLAMAPFLTRGNFDVTACLFEEGPLREQLEALSIPTHRLQMPLSFLQQVRRAHLHEYLQTSRPDLIHSNSMSLTRLAAPVAKSLEIPHLGYLRDIAKISGQVRLDLRQSSHLIAVSHAVKAWYENLGVPGELISVIHNGVDLKKYSPGPRLGPIRTELGIGDQLVVVGIGQLSLRKGFDIWLSAAERIATELPETFFLIAGEQHSKKTETDGYVSELRRRTEQGLLAGRVRWLGRRPDVDQLLRESDLLLHAAWQEPLGRVLLEAMAVGTPIVATNVGGTAEILPPEDHGRALAKIDDAQELAEKAIAILKSAPRREEIRRGYPAIAAEKFLAERAGRDLLAQYQSVYAGAAARSDESR